MNFLTLCNNLITLAQLRKVAHFIFNIFLTPGSPYCFENTTLWKMSRLDNQAKQRQTEKFDPLSQI